MDMRRVAGDRLCRLEAQVIVTVRRLRRAAGVHHVQLRGHLVVGAKPGLTDQCKEGVGVVPRKVRGVRQAVLFQGIPQPVIRPGFGKVVTAASTCAVLLVDKVAEDVRGAVDHRVIRLGPLQDDDARAVGEGVGPFGHQHFREAGFR